MIFGYLSGQGYHKLIEENKYWDVSYAKSECICGPFNYQTPPRRYSFKGDTMINGINYAKSYQSNFIGEWEIFCPPFVVDTNESFWPYHFLREDTIEKKVWLYSGPNDVDFLLFDFSLEQGDTLYPNEFWPIIIDTVYDIVTNDGLTRKKFEIIQTGSSVPEGYYIEGIGGVAGLFEAPYYYFYFPAGWPLLMCVKDSTSNSIYEFDQYCYEFVTSVQAYENRDKFLVYPNPFSTSTTLSYELKQPSTVQLSVFNQLGQLVHQKSEDQSQGKQHLQWDAQSQPEGMYYFTLQVGGQVTTGKMMVVR